MPFRFDELQKHFVRSVEQGRMGHSYLLTGDRAEELENLALTLAAQVLDAAPQQHADFHPVRPLSKSRQITVEQIRELERELHLKPYSAPLKVAAIFNAERMCLGQAAAANAFLKTLEEPPAHTLILLTSDRPALLLPTILSRCLRFDLGFIDIAPEPGPESDWINRWTLPHPSSALQAYARAQLLQELWASLREAAEIRSKELPEMEEDAVTALIEAEFSLSRQESIAQLQRWYWRRSDLADLSIAEKLRAITALEELQTSLSQNVEVNLAAERLCLRIADLN